jgi:curved DNA-binding protein
VKQADFSGFEDLFGRFGAGFGGGQQRSQRQQRSYRGEDQHASIQVDLDIAYHGSTQQITCKFQLIMSMVSLKSSEKPYRLKFQKE